MAQRFRFSIERLERCCERVDRLAESGKTAKLDADLVYESTFLAAVGHFEGFLEELLELRVCGPVQAGVRPLIQPKSKTAFRAIVLQGKKYADYLPFDRTKNLAGLYLHNGAPFTTLTESDEQELRHVSWIRNAIAHRTSHAVSVFRRNVPGVDTLPRNRRNPGPFLRHCFRTAPPQSYYVLYTATLKRIALHLAA